MVENHGSECASHSVGTIFARSFNSRTAVLHTAYRGALPRRATIFPACDVKSIVRLISESGLDVARASERYRPGGPVASITLR